MENCVTKQAENKSLLFPFKRAIITTIFYNDGTEGQMMTFSNLDVWFEEACIGIRKGLLSQPNVTACDIEVKSIVNGELREFTKFDRYYFTDEEREYFNNTGYRKAS